MGSKPTAMLDLEYIALSSPQLLIAVAISTLILVAIITLSRLYFARQSSMNLQEKYANKKWKSPLEARTKYPEVDVFRWSPVFLRLAMVTALGLIVLAFNWTTYEQQIEIPEDALVIEEDIIQEQPRTAEPPPPPPPPPPPVIQEVPSEAITDIDEEVEFIDQSIDAETAVDVPVITAEVKEEVAPPPPPPPPPPVEETTTEIFRVVEEMPRFPGCENIAGTKKDKKACAEKKLLEFIYSNIRYPAVARENGIEGTVVVQFVVDEKGNVSSVETIRDIGGSCGEEAIRVIRLMNDLPEKWSPGKQRGLPVKVAYILPVKFKMEYN